MNPEEKKLLVRAVELSEENNRILLGIQKTARWAKIWGFVKFVIIVTPIIIGFLYLQPYVDEIIKSFGTIKNLIPLNGSLPQ